MRISIVVVAAVVGWFWFASDDPGPRRDAPAARPRAADLSSLSAQLAAAERRTPAPHRDGDLTELAAELAAPDRDTDRADVAALIAATDQLSFVIVDDPLEVLEPARLDELLALPSHERDAAFAEALGRQLTIDDRLLLGIDEDDPPAIDVVGHEVINLESRVPIVDTSWTSSCGGFEVDYIRTIPVPGRTFEGVLGAAAESQGHDEGVSFSSGATSENVYIFE